MERDRTNEPREIAIGLRGDSAPDRVAVRAVTTDGKGRLYMVRTALGDYKFPGGGQKPGEDDLTTLCREVREELGRTVDMSAEPRFILRMTQRSVDSKDTSRLYTMESRYYSCLLTGEQTAQELDDYERELDFRLCLISPAEAVAANETLLCSTDVFTVNPWVYRDTVVLRELQKILRGEE